MAKKKILFIDASDPILPEKLEALGFECEFKLDSDRQELEKLLDQYFGVVVRSRIKIDQSFMDKAVQLKFVARYGVGLEHIDLEYAASKGIKVFSSPEGSMHTVGEHTLGMLIMLMNNLGRASVQVKNGKWIRAANRGVEIRGKTVGILGYGNMGKAFAQRLQGFQARVIAYDKYKEDYGDQFAEAVDLEVLFKESDILSVHIPYSPSNHYFINDEFIAAFAKPIYLLNTARGLVLNTEDLVKHLQEGKVVGAALDVIEYEEGSFVQLAPDSLPADFQFLRKAENVILTPHIAGWSHEAKKGHAEWLGRKIKNWWLVEKKQ